MKTVTLARDVRPRRAGEDVIVPDDIASQMVANGDAESARPFPEGAKDDKPRPAATYVTKERKK